MCGMQHRDELAVARTYARWLRFWRAVVVGTLLSLFLIAGCAVGVVLSYAAVLAAVRASNALHVPLFDN